MRTPTQGAIVDVHHHMFPPSLLGALAAADIDRLAGELVPAAWSPEQSIAMMDRYGIDLALLSAPVPLQLLGADDAPRLAREINEFAHGCETLWPHRFGFFASLPLPDVGAAVAEARYALDRLGAAGVTLLANAEGLYPGDRRLERLHAELDAQGAVCFVHPAVAAEPPSNAQSLQPSPLEFPFETTRAIASVVTSDVLDRFPRIRFVFPHCGGCVSSVADRMIDRGPIVETFRNGRPSISELEALLESAQERGLGRLRALHYDIALSSGSHALSALTEIVPPAQLLLGTDYPMAQEIGIHLALRTLIEFDDFTPSHRAAVRSANAFRLLDGRAA
jgi:predicted TIM-barrel fold metal-dependent hydrolase